MRVGRWGAYYEKGSPYDVFRTAVAPVVKKAWKDRKLITKPVVVYVTFLCSPPTKTILAAPKGDIDNYLKALFDALNKRVWKDDDQVYGCSARKFWADSKNEARIEVVIKELDKPWRKRNGRFAR